MWVKDQCNSIIVIDVHTFQRRRTNFSWHKSKGCRGLILFVMIQGGPSREHRHWITMTIILKRHWSLSHNSRKEIYNWCSGDKERIQHSSNQMEKGNLLVQRWIFPHCTSLSQMKKSTCHEGWRQVHMYIVLVLCLSSIRNIWNIPEGRIQYIYCYCIDTTILTSLGTTLFLR